jgi:hypothetical protein
MVVVKFLLMWDFLVPPLPFLYVYVSEFGGKAALVRDMKAYGEWRSSATHFHFCTRRWWVVTLAPLAPYAPCCSEEETLLPFYESNRSYSIVRLVVYSLYQLSYSGFRSPSRGEDIETDIGRNGLRKCEGRAAVVPLGRVDWWVGCTTQFAAVTW